VPGYSTPVAQHEHEQGEVTGKVNGLIFDHFGDFEGFIIETRFGALERFCSREERVMIILREALEKRLWITVWREEKPHEEVRTIIIRTPPPWP